MQVFINIKSIGKRKPALEQKPYCLPDSIITLRDLLNAVVKTEARGYNAKEADQAILPFLTEAQIDDRSTVGKVGFGYIYSDKKADVDKAISKAIQGFEDGLFRVMINDTEVAELDMPLTIVEGDTLTFIRLTFLAGRLW